MKKIIMVIMCFLLIFSFVACSPTENNNNVNNNNVNNNNVNNNNNDAVVDDNSEENDISNEDEVLITDEIFEVSYLGRHENTAEIYEYPYMINHVQDKFNIKLDFCPVSSIDKENIDLLVTAGNLPDCGWVYSGVTKEKALEYYTSEVIRSIPEELVQEYCPNFYEMISHTPVNHLLHLVPDKDDEYFCFFANRYGYDQIGRTVVMRYDWMENLGIRAQGTIENMVEFIYVTDKAYTMDEFDDIIYAFTYSDPDMNSENDTVGHIVDMELIWDHAFTATLGSAYGLNKTYNDDGTGWGVPMRYSPQAKKAYVKTNQWLQLGVLRVVDGTTQFYADWGTGAVGSCSWMLAHFVEKSPFFYIAQNIPEVKLLCCPGLTDNDGTGGRVDAYHNYEFTPNAGFFFINNRVKDEEKLKRILMFYDYTFIDTKGMLFCTRGEEGVHFEYNKWFDIESLDQSNLPDEKRFFTGTFSSPGIPKGLSAADPERPNIDSKMVAYSLEKWPALKKAYLIPPTAAEINLDIEWYARENKSARAAAEKEFVKKVFSGQANIDTEWDSFMSFLESMGYEEYLAEINTHGFLDSEYRLGNQVHPIDLYPTHE